MKYYKTKKKFCNSAPTFEVKCLLYSSLTMCGCVDFRRLLADMRESSVIPKLNSFSLIHSQKFKFELSQDFIYPYLPTVLILGLEKIKRNFGLIELAN